MITGCETFIDDFCDISYDFNNADFDSIIAF